MEINVGAYNDGGTMTTHGPVTGKVVGIAPPGTAGTPSTPGAAGRTGAAGTQGTTGEPEAGQHRRGADVGILTVLPIEHRALLATLAGLPGYRAERPLPTGPQVHRAEMVVAGEPVRIAAVQALDRGTEAAGVAHLQLVHEYAPSVVLLVGIAGGVGREVRLGDVVLSDEVVLYDPRKVKDGAVHHRGRTYVVSAALRHRLNDFLVATGGEVRTADGEPFRVRQGPIGSGAAVIADAHSEDREWLLRFNDKLLAVETEVAGVAQAFYQALDDEPRPVGWLTVRGICDLADAAKDDDRQEEASRHAAATALALIPHLRFATGGR
jgi:adenosylhomocysteine nucleosidase